MSTTVEIVRAVRVSKQGVHILIEVLINDGTEWRSFDLSAGSALYLAVALQSLLDRMRDP